MRSPASIPSGPTSRRRANFAAAANSWAPSRWSPPIRTFDGADRTIEQGDQLVVHVTTPDRYGIALLLATGSDAHLDALRALARRKGFVLDRDGLSRNGRVVARRTEAEIYAALGLPYIAPELRETGKEVQLRAEGKAARAGDPGRPPRRAACPYDGVGRLRQPGGHGGSHATSAATPTSASPTIRSRRTMPAD